MTRLQDTLCSGGFGATGTARAAQSPIMGSRAPEINVMVTGLGCRSRCRLGFHHSRFWFRGVTPFTRPVRKNAFKKISINPWLNIRGWKCFEAASTQYVCGHKRMLDPGAMANHRPPGGTPSIWHVTGHAKVQSVTTMALNQPCASPVNSERRARGACSARMHQPLHPALKP